MVVWTRVLGVMTALLLLAAAGRAEESPAPRSPTPVGDEQSPAPPVLRQFESVLGVVRDAPAMLLGQESLTGKWGGLRTRLNHWGVIPTATYVTDILGDPVGGKVHKVRYVHDIGADLLLDFQRMLGWEGSRFQVSMSSRAGSNLSADVGNVFTVAEACCDLTTRLVTLAWEQSLLEHRLSFRVGRLSTGDDFMTSPLYIMFVNSDLDANPFSALLNVPYAAYPGASWGASARGRPLEPLYLAVGVYNGNPSVQLNGAHGTDFSFSDDGVLLTFEAGYEPAHHRVGTLPGHYKVGGYYHTGRFRRFDAPSGSDLPMDAEYGNGGYYFLVDQMLYREQADQGLWPFAALVLAPNQEINTMPVFVGGGATYQGLIPGRDADVSMFSVVYGGFSRDLRRAQAGNPQGQQDFEMVVEWAYIIQVAPWLHLQPDFQYIIKPGGTGNIPDVLVIGAQIAVNL